MTGADVKAQRLARIVDYREYLRACGYIVLTAEEAARLSRYVTDEPDLPNTWEELSADMALLTPERGDE